MTHLLQERMKRLFCPYAGKFLENRGNKVDFCLDIIKGVKVQSFNGGSDIVVCKPTSFYGSVVSCRPLVDG